MDNEILEELKKLNQNLSNRGGFTGNTTSTGGGTGSGVFGKTLEGTTGLLKDFGKQINQGGGRLSTTTESISKAFDKGNNAFAKFASTGLGSVSAAIGYLEETTDVYRQLAKVGAGANGSLGALRAQAGTANLSLQTFSNLLGANSKQLVALGGSADRGGIEIAKLGRGLFDTGIIDQFLNLGYSIDEASEFVVKNTALQSRQALLEGMSTERQVKNAADLAKNMQIMAKLTGKDVAQMQDDLIARQRDGATQAALRLMEMGQAKNEQEYNKLKEQYEALYQDTVDSRDSLREQILDNEDLMGEGESGRGFRGDAFDILEKINNPDDTSQETEELRQKYRGMSEEQIAGALVNEYVEETFKITVPSMPEFGQMQTGQQEESETIDQRPGVQEGGMIEQQGKAPLTFEELRARLPREVSDAVVRLITQSEAALLDFAQIETQEDIARFNVKYNTDLQLPAQVA